MFLEGAGVSGIGLKNFPNNLVYFLSDPHGFEIVSENYEFVLSKLVLWGDNNFVPDFSQSDCSKSIPSLFIEWNQEDITSDCLNTGTKSS